MERKERKKSITTNKQHFFSFPFFLFYESDVWKRSAIEYMVEKKKNEMRRSAPRTSNPEVAFRSGYRRNPPKSVRIRSDFLRIRSDLAVGIRSQGIRQLWDRIRSKLFISDRIRPSVIDLGIRSFRTKMLCAIKQQAPVCVLQ